jgi:hypothetical protein
LPLTWCARDLPERGTNVLNIRRIEWSVRHTAECDDDSAAESIFDTEIGLAGIVIQIIQMRAKITPRHVMNLM